MKCLVLISIIAAAHAYPSAPHPLIDVYPIHPGVGAIYKGPNSETIIAGPDGSVITAEAIGGSVAIKEDVTPLVAAGPVVAAPAPIIAPLPVVSTAPVLAAAPAIVPAGPAVIAAHAAVAPVAAPVLLNDHPIVVQDIAIAEPKIVEETIVVGNKVISVPKLVEESSDLIGPSGTISTRGGDVVVSGPASTTIKGGGVIASIDKQPDIPIKTVEVKPVIAPVIVKPVPVVSPVVPVVSSAAVSLGPRIVAPALGPVVSRHSVGPALAPVLNDLTLGHQVLAASPGPIITRHSVGPTLAPVLDNVALGYGAFGSHSAIEALPLNHGPLVAAPIGERGFLNRGEIYTSPSVAPLPLNNIPIADNIITEARPVLPAHGAVVADTRVPGGIIHPIAQHRPPVLNAGPLVAGHAPYAPPYYKGPAL